MRASCCAALALPVTARRNEWMPGMVLASSTERSNDVVGAFIESGYQSPTEPSR